MSVKMTVDFLYSLFPEIVRNADAEIDTLDESKNRPLYRFLQILVGGLNPLEEDIDKFLDLFDVDKCPDNYLPLLASLLGFEFPFDLSPKVQRRFIKYIPSFYAKKGTKPATEFIIKDLLNFDVNIISEDPATRTFEIAFVVAEDDTEAVNLESKARILLDTYKVANSGYTLALTYSYSEIWRPNFPLEEFEEYEVDSGMSESSGIVATIEFRGIMREQSSDENISFDLGTRGLNLLDKFILNSLDGSKLNDTSGFIEDYTDIEIR